MADSKGHAPAARVAESEPRGAPAGPTLPVRVPTMLALGVGWAGTQVFWAFHTGTMPLFLKEYTSSKFQISLVLSLAGVTGCLIPPVIGYLSDRTRSRFGRRAPYIVGGMLGGALCLAALPGAGAYVAVALLAALMYAGVGLAQAPYLSLLPDVTPPQQRSTASGVMNLCGSVGLIAYFAGSAALWETHPRLVINMVALLACTTVLVPIATIREPATVAVQPIAGLRAYLTSVVREKPLMTYFVAQTFWWLGHWIAVTFFTLFVVEELGVAEGQSQYVPMVFGLVVMLAVLPIGILGDRVGRKSILTLAIALGIVMAIAVTFAQTLTHALLAAAFMATPFAALMSVGYAFLLDLVPEGRTAEFVGLSILTVAAAQIVGPILGGLLIDVLGYRAIFPAASLSFAAALVILQFVRVRPHVPTTVSEATGA